jgi:hypothetical protein
VHHTLIIPLADLPINLNELQVLRLHRFRRVKLDTAVFPERQRNLHGILPVIVWIHELHARVQHDALVVEVKIGIDEQRVLVSALVVLVVVDGVEVLDRVEAVFQAKEVVVADFGHRVLACLLDGRFGGFVVNELSAVEVHVAVAIFALVLLSFELAPMVIAKIR